MWSRSVQHGATGGYNVIERAFTSIGGFSGKSEADLIRAIYAESGAVVSTPPSDSAIPMTSAGAEQNGIYGMYMKYYSRNSSSVQYGVWLRLNVNELNTLLNLINDPPVDITPQV